MTRTMTIDGMTTKARGALRRALLRGALLIALAVSPSVATASLIPLYSWYSPSRGDNFATTDPNWAGRPGDTRGPDYSFVRIEGLVFSPADPKPQGTRTLYSWWSPSRGDNFLTTDPAWAGRVGDTRAPDYVLFRIEGYVYDSPVAGTLPLQSWWNPGPLDNFTTADPAWTARAGLWSSWNGYSLSRTEGWLQPHFYAQPPFLPTAFGSGVMRTRGTNRPAVGPRPLLVIMVEYSDLDRQWARYPQYSPTYYDTHVFGPTGFTDTAQNNRGWTIPGFFTENSHGRFTWTRAGVIGPLRKVDQPGTSVDEASYAYAGSNLARHIADVLRLASAQHDFAQYDVNHDGQVTSDELGVMIIGPAPGSADGGQTDGGPTNVTVATPSGRQVTLRVVTSRFDASVGFQTIAHELTHQLGAVDVYGEGAALNQTVSLMAATMAGNDVHLSFHLDPWHKIQLGWTEPRIFPISASGAFPGISLPLNAASDSSTPAYDPIILFDPNRGTNEYFIVEYRSPSSYDASVRSGADHGVAAWHVITNPDKTIKIISKIRPGTNGVLDSHPTGDDYVDDWDRDGVNDVIRPGNNLALETLVAPTDLMVQDATDYLIGAPNRTLGLGGLWRSVHNEVRFTWMDRSDSGVRMRVAADPVKAVEWNMETNGTVAQKARIDGGPSSVRVGYTLSLTGMFGVRQASRWVVLTNASYRVSLPVVSWSMNSIVAQVPAGVPAGTYSVMVVNDVAYSNPVAVTVTQ